MVSIIGYLRYGTIHTVSTSVKRGSLTGAEARAAQGAATRATLIAVACDLFGKKGFQDTSLDEVVVKAKVTKGAL